MVPVDGGRHGAPHLHVVERRDLGVHRFALDGPVWLGRDERRPSRVRAEHLELRVVEVVREVEATVLERVELTRAVHRERPLDGVDEGLTRAEVALVPHEERPRPRSHPFGARACMGPPRTAATCRSSLLPALGQTGRSGVERENREEARIGLAETNRDDVPPLDHDPAQVLGLPVVYSAKPRMVSNRLAVGFGVFG